MAGIIVGDQNPSAIATVVASRTLPRLKANTVAYACADVSYANEIATFGDTVNIPIPAEFTSSLLAEGGTINRQNPALGNAALILSQHREISWEHNDVNVAFATPDLHGTSLGQAMANFCEDVDEDLLSIYTSFSQTVGAFNNSLTEPIIDDAETTLFNQRAGVEGERHLIISGTGYGEVRQIAKFAEYQLSGRPDGTTRQNIMGTLKGFKVYRAQKLNITNSGVDDNGIALAPTALLVAVRPLGVTAKDGTIQVELSEDNLTIRMTMSYHHEVLGDLTTIDMLYGFVAGRTIHGIHVKH